MTGYYIYAKVHDGRPTLQVVDADSSKVCLQWSYPAQEVATDEASDREIHDLFRQLMLLTCKQTLNNSHAVELTPAQLTATEVRRAGRFQKPRKVA